MSTYGVTAQGFVRKPYTVILEELQAKARSGEYFGSDVDLSDENYIGAEIKLKAWALDQQWQLAEAVYYSFDMDNAEGVALARLAKLGLTERKDAVYATVDLVFTGDAGSSIPIGTQVETETGIVFETTVLAEIGEAGQVTVQAQCMTSGADGNVPASSISVIKTPIAGIDTVSNPSAAENGRGIETDAELRERYHEAPASSGSALDSILADVAELDAVEDVIGNENTGNEEDENGLPPKSFEIIVYGGTDAGIAQAIYAKKGAGISTYGNTSYTITDSKGKTHVIMYSRPVDTPIWVKFILETNSGWSTEQESTVGQYAVDYINALQTGQDVYAWKIASLLAGVSGLEKATALLGTASDTITQEKIDLSIRQKASTTLGNVSIEYE